MNINPYPTVNDEILSLFIKNPTAFIIWLYAISKVNRNHNFIPRKQYIKNKIKIGDKKFNNAIRFLKEKGLLETFPIPGKGGQMKGSEYRIYDFEDRVMNPSPTDSPGPQKGTRAINLMKNHSKHESNTIKPLEPISNGDVTDSAFIRQSDKVTTYIQEGGGRSCPPPNLKIKNTSSKFTKSEPEEHKKQFIELFPGQNTFQTFDDSPKKDRKLSHIYNEYDQWNLDALNNKGAGIFLTINETDGKGRKKGNIIKVRAVFADLDGAPLGPVLKYNPSIVVESSPERYHTYWLTDDTPLESFSSLQKAIARMFDGDNVKDLSRVMRIPGYYHHKKEPILCKILYTNSREKYSFSELEEMFPQPSPRKLNPFADLSDKPFEVHGVEKGQRNTKLCKLIGGMKKNGCSEEEISQQAYKFAETCSPPLRKSVIESVLKSAISWE